MQSVEGVHPIALINEGEKYETLQLAMGDIITEVQDLQLITVDGETFPVRFLYLVHIYSCYRILLTKIASA